MISVEKIDEVINLADERKTLYDTGSDLDHIQLDTPLLNYLNLLTFDELKSLQAVMYLGRGDGEYDSTLTPGEIYNSMFNELEQQGWETMDIEAHQILGKIPLGRYLQEGKILAGI